MEHSCPIVRLKKNCLVATLQTGNSLLSLPLSTACEHLQVHAQHVQHAQQVHALVDEELRF